MSIGLNVIEYKGQSVVTLATIETCVTGGRRARQRGPLGSTVSTSLKARTSSFWTGPVGQATRGRHTGCAVEAH
jgi:hypothetical protein